jgi:FMN reductase
MTEMRVAVLVGNPKQQSRTYSAALMAAKLIFDEEPTVILDLATLGAELLNWESKKTAEAISSVERCDALIVASPTFKATYTGLLKLFLDCVPANGFKDKLAFPIMLGAGPAHALAPELLLKPVLVELGAVCPSPGLYLIDKTYETDANFVKWATAARRFTKWSPESCA